MSAVDLFCGVGGLTHGLINSGINVIAGVDNDSTCKYAYERNNGSKFIETDIKSITAAEISELYPVGDIRILIGCAPCQPFSSITQRYRDKEKRADWNMLGEFGRIVKGIRPTVISMENVPQLREETPFKKFTNQLQGLGFHIWYGIVKCHEYGVPQKRRRLVLLASRLGEITLIPPTHGSKDYETVRKWIGNLQKLEAGCTSDSDPIHKCQNLTDINVKRIKASRPGGTWRDWDKSLQVRCHQKKSGKSYSPVYGRMEWDEPAPTITAQFYNYGSGRFGHPEQDRPISLREGALLQSFPREYIFVKPADKARLTSVGQHIGNAVPVRLGEAIGRSIVMHLEKHLDTRIAHNA